MRWVPSNCPPDSVQVAGLSPYPYLHLNLPQKRQAAPNYRFTCVCNMDESSIFFTRYTRALISFAVKGVDDVVGPDPIAEKDLKKVATLPINYFTDDQKLWPILPFKGGRWCG